jgi:hypothetical protein
MIEMSDVEMSDGIRGPWFGYKAHKDFKQYNRVDAARYCHNDAAGAVK